MHVAMNIPASPKLLAAACWGLVAVNVQLLARSQLPSLYRSKVVYRPEPVGQENWLTCEQIYSRGTGDCEDLASWRAAELRRAGEPARVVVIRSTTPHLRRRGRVYHAVVRRADGRIEDPSRVLRRLERARLRNGRK
jgi:hypothetical protein